MDILSVQIGADTAGQASRMKEAFDRHSDWSFRYVTQPPVSEYIHYPRDLHWSQRKLVEPLWRAADVIHVHNNFESLKQAERRFRDLRGKPVVMHHHGTYMRQNLRSILAEQRERRALGIVSTMDLHLLAVDDTEWLPAPYDVDWLASLRKPHGTDVIRIAHAPTNREIKSTAAFIAAIERLQAEGYPVEMDLIEQVSWRECLVRKARADIFFDQVILGYGCNSLEAWGMGIPVISGASITYNGAPYHGEAILDEMERRFGYLPFYQATESTIYESLRDLVEDAGLREQYAQQGQQYVRTYHHYPAVVDQLQGIYRRAVDTYRAKAA